MLNNKLTLLAACAVGAVTLSACAKPEPKCISAEGPFVVEDQTYGKLGADALPRCEEKKPRKVRDGEVDGEPGPGPSAPGPDSPGQPDSPGERA